MLNSLHISAEDRKESAAIERRRRYEESRKQRIFNARRRVIGIDTTVLEQQIQERHQLNEQEREQQRKFEEEQRRQTQLLYMKNQEQQRLRSQIQDEINQFRKLNQRPEQSRDFDLFDPNGLKKSLPARVGDHDPRLTISGAQKFEGEDLTGGQRKRMQIQQQKSWLEQQIREKRREELDRVAASKFLQEALEARERKALKLAAEEREARCKIQESINQFNKSLVQQQNYQREQQKREEEQDNMAEIYNHLTSDIMTENPDVAKSALGPNRVIAYRYKGMNPEQLQEFRNGQQQQRETLKQRQSEDQMRKETWDKLANDFDRMAVQNERHVNHLRRQIMSATASENQNLSDEQQRKLDFMNRVVYQNVPTIEYFEQFNTTTR
ncbi:RIB43A-like with coiled-coils protein 2 [Uranotaenia lowii]|uniref:RIB43A-like with coiled-coils protein 2 n=1 Tax=Uranotaenia lowii TaxID=190385 RepID=UPI00247A995A|nr:RIB43A-like with coiled-coils protein 2 [Uranotaenia lowii]